MKGVLEGVLEGVLGGVLAGVLDGGTSTSGSFRGSDLFGIFLPVVGVPDVEGLLLALTVRLLPRLFQLVLCDNQILNMPVGVGWWGVVEGFRVIRVGGGGGGGVGYGWGGSRWGGSREGGG